MSEAELLETIQLLLLYGDTKFGDEWWPGNAVRILGPENGYRLGDLLDRVDCLP